LCPVTNRAILILPTMDANPDVGIPLRLFLSLLKMSLTEKDYILLGLYAPGRV